MVDDMRRAELFYQTAMEIRKKVLGTTHPEFALSLSGLAELYESRGDHVKAEPLLGQALDISFANLESAATVQSERQQMAMAEYARRGLDQYLLLATRTDEYHESAYRRLLAWKGSVFARQTAMRAARDIPELRSLYDGLEGVAAQLSRVALAVPKPEEKASWQRQISSFSAKKESLERQLADKSRKYREARPNVTLEQLRAALPADTVLIDFVESIAVVPPAALAAEQKASEVEASKKSPRGQPRLLAFVVRREGPIELIVLKDPQEVGKQVEAWRTTGGAMWRLAFGLTIDSRTAGAWLRENVWQPIEDRLPANTKTVLISPDGALSRFPFAALPGKQPDTYLLEDWPIAMIASPQALPALLSAAPAPAPGRLLLLDALDVGRTDRNSKSPTLTAKTGNPDEPSLQEILTHEFLALKDLYQKRYGASGLVALSSGSATEYAMRQAAPKHRHLHLAAHGIFASDEIRRVLSRPTYDESLVNETQLVNSQALEEYHPNLLSVIALARSSQAGWEPNNDGILTSEEIQTLDLRGVDLVVLSSCQTALGEEAPGEALLGIQRAFHVAGARTVVSALWSVQVIATGELMGRFYDNLWNKHMDKLSALREAQLWMLRERGGKGILRGFTAASPGAEGVQRLPPFYWAGFVLSGEWQGTMGRAVER